jgi:hypothetical protein
MGIMDSKVIKLNCFFARFDHLRFWGHDQVRLAQKSRRSPELKTVWQFVLRLEPLETER